MDSFCFVFLCLGPDTCIPVSQRTVWSFSASDAPVGSTARQPVHQNLSCTSGRYQLPDPDPNRCLKRPSPTQGGGARGPHFPALDLGAGEWEGDREGRSEIKVLPLTSEYVLCVA